MKLTVCMPPYLINKTDKKIQRYLKLKNYAVVRSQ